MNRFGNLLAASVLGGITVAAITQWKGGTDARPFSAEQPLPVKLTSGGLPANAIDFTKAADLTIHAVVHIKTVTNGKTITRDPFADPFRNFFFGGGGYQIMTPPSAGSGSGVIISDDGYICTNNHVIQDADKIEVVLNNNKSYTAEVIGKDPTTDLALLKIDEKSLPFIHFGNSDDVKVGQWVLAVGNPFNLTSTVTAGIVSAKGRNINALDNDPANGKYSIESYIQTDAAVNPGNSGGALVNTDGELVGINSAIASNTGSYTGYSFAIPVNIVRKVMSDLKEFGSVQRAFIGVSIRDIDSKLSEEKGLKTTQGVYVAGVTNGGAAERSGIREGDVITRIGESPIKTTPELQEQVSRYRPGDRIQVQVLRNGDAKEMEVTLRNKNGETEIIRNVSSAEKSNLALGASFESVNAEEKRKLRIGNGLKVVRMQTGKLMSSGIREGFIITHVDKRPVDSVDDLVNYLEGKKGGVLLEGVYQNGVRGYYGFGL